MTDIEKKWAAVTVVVCATALAVIETVSALCSVGGATGVIVLAGPVLAFLCGLALWLCAWECGRRFEREHGGRNCGAPSEHEWDEP